MFDALRRMSIRSQIVILTGTLVVVTTIAFSLIGYTRQKQALLSGIDQKLMTAAYLARCAPPADYFNRVGYQDAANAQDYTGIVAEHNELCRALDLQYLWSCMQLGDVIVFTTATSPSKDVTRGDHADYLEVHRDPNAFDTVFRTMQPDFNSFHNEWGHGRMVLVPFHDEHGRSYCVGASMAINRIHALLRQTLLRSVFLGTAVLLAALLLAVTWANRFSQPIRHLTRVADQVSHGNSIAGFDVHGSPEIESLARSLHLMHESLDRTITALQVQIDERRQAQAALREHRDHLEDVVRQRTAELRRSNAELQQFAYAASHDLQEPLRKISAFGKIVLDRYADHLPEKGSEYLQHAINASGRMSQLINDLLQLSRVTTKAEPFQSVDLNRIVKEVLSDLEIRISQTKGRVDTESLPAIEADPTQMRQLFQNLIANGLKFHRPDVPPRVHVAARPAKHVPESLDANGEYVEITVSDNGIGIDEKYGERIFGIFQRLHARDAYEGSGVGLSICRRIVERHGGSIEAHGTPGEGTRFVIILPLHAQETPTDNATGET